MIDRYVYPVDLTADEDGGFVAVIPDVAGAVTEGDSREEALANAADCVEEAIAAAMEAREDVPAPSRARGRPTVVPGALIAAKLALYTALRGSGQSQSALARAMAVNEAEVRRMLDPRHRTKIERLEAALAVFGKRVVIEVHAGN